MPDETVQTKKHMCPVMIDREDYLWLKTKPRGYLTKLVRSAINEAKAEGIKILPDERAHLNPCNAGEVPV